jgi:hypothetical protein
MPKFDDIHKSGEFSGEFGKTDEPGADSILPKAASWVESPRLHSSTVAVKRAFVNPHHTARGFHRSSTSSTRGFQASGAAFYLKCGLNV